MPDWHLDKGFKELCKLAVWANRFTPLVALDNEALQAYKRSALPGLSPLHNGITLEISGTEKLFQGESNLTAKIEEAFARRNCRVRMAIAPAFGASWALSRYAGSKVVSISSQADLKGALAPLPAAALRIDHRTVLSLKEVGIETIGGVLALPFKTLLRRFGAELLSRLDAALGHSSEALHYIKPRLPFSACKRFNSPLITQESLLAVILELLCRVLQLLSVQNRKAHRFVIEAERVNLDCSRSVITKEASLYKASKKAAHIKSVLLPFVESIQAAQGIYAVRVTARNTLQVHAAQGEIGGGQTDNYELFDELLNHFTTRLGGQNLRKILLKASFLPERAFDFAELHAKQDSAPDLGRYPSSDRPSFLFGTPQSISAIAMLPDRPPSLITWRGQRLKLLSGFGPERIGEEWWLAVVGGDVSVTQRDYFKVQDQSGRWLWIFRDLVSMQWFVHGMWV
ncbi:MAG: hypothetical protein DCC75_03800 [Proteobacteria bacterium]|nr:MAG: hypothetical protein DCC75_03800 [Pseudomonadota bacterium]